MIQTLTNALWYASHPLRFLLWPFSLLFRLIVCLRRTAYRLGVFKSEHFPVPVIVVGNLTVGGSGKTPLVIYLVNYLQQQGYYPGIVSRGYGGRAGVEPVLVTKHHVAQEVGDEALLMKHHCDAPLVVGRKRVQAVRYLLDMSFCNVVICDDGLQHYALARELEIVVIDGQRRFGNGLCLPAGPLREPVSRLSQVDFVVTNGEADPGEYAMQLVPERFVNLVQAEHQQEVNFFQGKRLHAVAGIGNPQRFFRTLTDLGCEFTEHVFPDHHPFQAQDFTEMRDGLIIMTEKDAVKCRAFANDQFWYLPVVAKPDAEFIQAFEERLAEVSS